MSERPLISGSMAGKCRLMIWLKAHGYQEEPVQPGSQRTFDLGHIIEAAMFRGVQISESDTEGHTVGPWWPNLGEVKDHATGQSFNVSEAVVTDFQRTVAFAGYEGHIDGIVTLPSGRYVIDCKSTQGFGFDRAMKSDLYADPFAHNYVCQLVFYVAGLREQGEDIKGGLLLYFNKEQSAVHCRFVEYSDAIAEEVKERLSWAKSGAEPEPDWAWVRGEKTPLACSYCSFKQGCAGVRGLNLKQEFDKKNKPVWIVS